MITGAHSIIYSTNADADRAFLQDVLALPSVDVGGGWLIFGLPPAEVAVHPATEGEKHELYLMCDDVEAFVAAMARHEIACGPIQDQGWGRLTNLTLPGGGTLGVYQPRHARPPMMTVATPKRAAAKAKPKPKAKATAKKPAPKAAKKAAKKAAPKSKAKPKKR